MLLELSNEERELLEALISRELGDIGPEIRHTSQREYREDLKAEKRVLSQLLDRLQVAQPQ